MKELTLPEIKEIELEILRYFKNVCNEMGLRYYLSNGSLLGAIKYRGFIPWDDDVDVFVPREDYERLINEFRDTEKYVLFASERQRDFGFPFIKLCDVTTLKNEIGINNGVELGLNIDIFPLDAWPATKKQAKHVVRKVQRYLRCMTLSKLPYTKGKNAFRTIIKMIVLCYLKCVGTRHYVKKVQKTAGLYVKEERAQFVGCIVWPIYGEKEILPAEVFSDTIEVEFEGEIFPAPIGYDKYLRSLYGDYEQDPPLEKQITHHNFTACRLQ